MILEQLQPEMITIKHLMWMTDQRTWQSSSGHSQIMSEQPNNVKVAFNALHSFVKAWQIKFIEKINRFPGGAARLQAVCRGDRREQCGSGQNDVRVALNETWLFRLRSHKKKKNQIRIRFSTTFKSGPILIWKCQIQCELCCSHCQKQIRYGSHMSEKIRFRSPATAADRSLSELKRNKGGNGGIPELFKQSRFVTIWS